MSDAELDDDDEVARMAVEALSEAQRRFRNSGNTVVVLVDGKLLQIEPSGVTTVLKTLPDRPSVTVRTKRARS